MARADWFRRACRLHSGGDIIGKIKKRPSFRSAEVQQGGEAAESFLISTASMIDIWAVCERFKPIHAAKRHSRYAPRSWLDRGSLVIGQQNARGTMMWAGVWGIIRRCLLGIAGGDRRGSLLAQSRGRRKRGATAGALLDRRGTREPPRIPHPAKPAPDSGNPR